MTVINTNSPLRLDGPMSDGLIEMALHGQPVVATPFTLAGAMSPVSLAGALAQQNAEALFLVALAQIVRPGAPMVYGAFTSNVDMRTGCAGLRHARSRSRARSPAASWPVGTACRGGRRTRPPPTSSMPRPPTSPRWPSGAR